MFCEKCGKEMQEDWVVCPSCGAENPSSEESVDEESMDEEINKEMLFNISAWRRTGKFRFKEIKSEVTVNHENISVSVNAKKMRLAKFTKNDIQKISFSYEPEWYVADIVRVVLFLLLMPITYGLAAFAAILFLYIASMRHLVITLQDSRKVKIPIKQKAEVSGLLRELGYPESEVKEFERKRVSDGLLSVGEWITFMVLFLIAAVTISYGMERFVANMNDQSAQEQRAGTKSNMESEADKRNTDSAKEDSDTAKDNSDSGENEGGKNDAEVKTYSDMIDNAVEVSTDDILRAPQKYDGAIVSLTDMAIVTDGVITLGDLDHVICVYPDMTFDRDGKSVESVLDYDTINVIGFFSYNNDKDPLLGGSASSITNAVVTLE